MNYFKSPTFAISPLWITHFCKWAIWTFLDVLYGNSFWMSSSYSVSCVPRLMYISIWWSQPGQKHKTDQQEKPGHFLDTLTSTTLTEQEAAVWQILETPEFILYNFSSWFSSFKYYYPKVAIFYKTIPFGRLALIVNHL